MIPLQRPSLNQDELNKVWEVFESRWLGMGSFVNEFEEQLRKFIGCKHVIAVNTGTSALHLALDVCGINKSHEVLVPSFTFVATVQAIAMTGATPVFCDIDEETLNINIADAVKKISKKTKAVIPVHYGGQSCNMDALIQLTKDNNIFLVEDAAHAFGSYYEGKRIGSVGQLTCFSFDPIKNITCGEGGAITTNDESFVEKILHKRILGIENDTLSRSAHEKSWFYNVNAVGFRYHMSNINAAIGIVQLTKFEEFHRRKTEIVKKYDDAFSRMSKITLLKRDYKNTSFFNYVIRVECDRDKLISFLNKNGIDSGVHYRPNHMQPIFMKHRCSLPTTERVWTQLITLPLYYELQDTQVNYIISKVAEYLIDN